MTTAKFTGSFGYRSLGTNIQQCALVIGDEGVTAHQVAYTPKGAAIPGPMLDDFRPTEEQIYTYNAVRRALQKARTEERLYGVMSLVGAAGGMTRFGTALGGTKTFSVEEWVNKLTFDGLDAGEIYQSLVDTYAEG